MTTSIEYTQSTPSIFLRLILIAQRRAPIVPSTLLQYLKITMIS